MGGVRVPYLYVTIMSRPASLRAMRRQVLSSARLSEAGRPLSTVELVLSTRVNCRAGCCTIGKSSLLYCGGIFCSLLYCRGISIWKSFVLVTNRIWVCYGEDMITHVFIVVGIWCHHQATEDN